MQNAKISTPPDLFVVILREFLIARDIEMIMRDLWDDARVILAPTLDEAAAALPKGRIRAAFVQMDAIEFAASGLGRRVAEDGGRTVLVGQEPEAPLPEGWSVLDFPFSQRHVSALLTEELCD